MHAPTPASLTDPEVLRRRLARIRERLYEDAPNEASTRSQPRSSATANELVGMIGVVGSIQDIPSPPSQRQIDLVRGSGAALSEALHGTLYRERGIAIPKEFKAIATAGVG